MRPRIFTLRNILLLLVAGAVFGSLAYWLSIGAPIPGPRIASTEGKIAFVSDRSGHEDIYLMDRDGSNPVAITNDEAEDSQPAWSPHGNRIAFISNRARGGSPQLFLMYAAPGQQARQVTITSGAKSDPRFTKDGTLFFLDSGKVATVNPQTSESDAVLPSSDTRLLLANLFSTGGIGPAEPSPDGSLVAGALGLEQGKALLLLDRKDTGDHHDDELNLLGMASGGVLFSFMPDNTFMALFIGGGPLPQKVTLLSEEILEQNPGHTPPPLPSAPETDVSTLVHVGPDGLPTFEMQMPIVPNALVAAPDGSGAAITVDEGNDVGVFLLMPGGDQGNQGRKLFDQPARQPAFSPDGKYIAFVGGKDIYVVPTDGSAEATNLTQGKGNNRAPAWSPRVSGK